jgi:hypothetical protein
MNRATGDDGVAGSWRNRVHEIVTQVVGWRPAEIRRRCCDAPVESQKIRRPRHEFRATTTEYGSCDSASDDWRSIVFQREVE